MEIELERTFLVKELPKDLEEYKSLEISDIYIPESVEHPVLRIRKIGDDKIEMTKKTPIRGNDSSEQKEETIYLSKGEFSELIKIPGKKLRKRRCYYSKGGIKAEIDVYLDDLKGLILVDFEFTSVEDKNNFIMPDFCLVDVTQEKFSAAGILAGKKYSEIEPFLNKYNYKKINYGNNKKENLAGVF